MLTTSSRIGSITDMCRIHPMELEGSATRDGNTLLSEIRHEEKGK
jgi:hypothetical protein